MKRSAILINTARCGVIDQRALYDALKSGGLAHTGVDVTDPEPIARDDPLLRLDNATVVPHVAQRDRGDPPSDGHDVVENVIAGIRGDATPYCVNPEALKNRRT